MSQKESQDGGKLGFLDALGRIFRGRPADATPAAPEPQTSSGFAVLEAEFDAAIRGLNERVEEQRRAIQTAASASGASAGTSAEERAAAELKRMATSHQAIREDIEKMHARLGTGLSGADLDALTDFLTELHKDSTAGRDSHDLVPRARYAIAERLRAEAGELAIARLVALLQSGGLDWPDPTHYRPTATPEEVERSRRRRLADVRQAFLSLDLERTAERLQGIVRGWGGDYPDRGSPLWEETVLEAVAAAFRGRLLRDFVELVRRERELLLSRTEAAVGKELTALRAVLEGGVHSIERANQAIATSLRALDKVVPEIAWELVAEKLPEARDEASASP